jgi:hypothetical protein
VGDEQRKYVLVECPVTRPDEAADPGANGAALELEGLERAPGDVLVEPPRPAVVIELDHRLVSEGTFDTGEVPWIADELRIPPGMDELDLVFHPSDVEAGEVKDPPTLAG